MRKYGYLVVINDEVNTDYLVYSRVTAEKQAKEANRETVKRFGKQPIKYTIKKYKRIQYG